MHKQGVEFFEGVPTHDDLKKWLGDQQGGILVLDDLMLEGGDDKDILNLFTQYSHHLNVTVFYLYQDMFSKGEYAKTISRNAQYIIVFKNPRDNVALRTLLTEMHPNKKWCPVMDTYNQCAQRPFGYLAIDVNPASRDDTRLVVTCCNTKVVFAVTDRPWTMTMPCRFRMKVTMNVSCKSMVLATKETICYGAYLDLPLKYLLL